LNVKPVGASRKVVGFKRLNLLYFCLCGRLKSTACATEVSDLQGLQQQIQKRSEMIETKPGIFQ
jgi:hypothetical protein